MDNREDINRELRIKIAEATAEDIKAAWDLLKQLERKRNIAQRCTE